MIKSTDKIINQCINDSVQYYRADLRSAYDYYPFGMLIPDRTFDSVAYVQLPDRVDTTIIQRIKIQIPTLNPGQIISLSKDGETYVLAQYQSGYTGAQYSANIAGSAIVNELSFEDSAGYLIIENTTLGGQTICSGIPSYSLNIAGSNYVVNCSQSIDTIRGGLLSEAGYLFGFNGMEKDDEWSSHFGSHIDFGERIYNCLIGRFFSCDPIEASFPSWSPYIFAGNDPIKYIDLFGMGPGDRIKFAKSKIGTPYKQQDESNLRTLETTAALKYMDCSELICRVLANDKFTSGVKHMNTTTLLTWFPDNGWDVVTTPKPGDVIVWEGHTALVESYDAKNKRVHVIHATKYGSVSEVVAEDYSMAYYEKKGAKFFRPSNENPDDEDSKEASSDWSISNWWDSWSLPDLGVKEWWDSWSLLNFSFDFGANSSSTTYKVSTGGSNLNLRLGAGKGFQIVGSVLNGTTLKGTGNFSEGWAEVVTQDGKKGWVSSKYLKVQ